MFSWQPFWIGIAVTLAQTGYVTSHGRLIVPAQRSSAWRYGYANPENYQDNELFCGGFGVQWNKYNKGRCGVCGDPFNAKVKPNEDVDGKYVINGVITGSYVKGGVVNAEVEITAYHKGWFEFRLCPLASTTEKVTQECLDKTLLKVAGTDTTRFQLEEHKVKLGPGIYEINLQLPPSVTCDRCVLQWKYNTGNSWNCDSDGCGIGRGPQENFVNCADIRIKYDGTGTPLDKSSPTGNQSATMTVLKSPTTEKPPPSTARPTEVTTKTSTTTIGATVELATTENQITTSGEEIKMCSNKLACIARKLFSRLPGILEWCCNNCGRGHCPSSHCLCIKMT